MNLKENILRVIYADTIGGEFIMGVFAIAQASAKLSVPADRTLASAVIFIGILRIASLLFRRLWMRLAVAYAAVFSWTYFILFVFMDSPSPHMPGGIAAAAANAWVAWRLQTEQHIRKDIAIEKARVANA